MRSNGSTQDSSVGITSPMDQGQSKRANTARVVRPRPNRKWIIIASWVLILLSIITWMLSVLLLAPADDRLSFAVVSSACFSMPVIFGAIILVIFRASADRTQVPHAYAAVISEDRRRLTITRGPGEVRHSLGDNQDVTLHDLRDRHLAATQDCFTKDRAKVTVKWSVVWNITDIERFMDSAQDPETILLSVARALLTYYIGKHESKDLAPNFERMADEMTTQAYNRVHRYGIFVASFNLTEVQLPAESPKSPKPGEQEAERIRNVNSAVNEANLRSLRHIERMTKASSDHKGEDKNK